MAPGAISSGVDGAPTVLRATASHDAVCRCGTRLQRGEPCVEVVGLSGLLQGWFRDQTFCSAGCVRAALLEDLSILESLDTAEAEAQVTDLRDTYLVMASTISRLVAPGVNSDPVPSPH